MNKKIVIASDSFKGSATSKEIGTYISEGIHSLYPEYETLIFSIADGGEGTVDAIMEVNDGKKITLTVKGPLGQDVNATYGIVEDGKVAIIEMAEASGLTLVEKEKLDVLNSSTYGTGQLILDAVNKGVNKIYIGIGGSATNDGGMGMAQALGAKFLNEAGDELVANGKNLVNIDKIDMTDFNKDVNDVEIIMLSDVTNPLCGSNGAAAIYGPQKGATKEIIEELDKGLEHFANIIKDEFGVDIIEKEGSGAAGGLGAGLIVFLKAKAHRGIEEILRLIQIEKAIMNADLVITGEGSLDGQSINGKAPIGIANIAKKYDVPSIAIVGSKSLDLDNVYEAGISGVFDIIHKPMTLEEAMNNTPENIRATTKNIISFFSTINKN